MKVIWIHTYDVKKKGGGIFMIQQINYFHQKEVNIHLYQFYDLFNPIKFFRQLFQFRNKFKNEIVHAQYGSGTAFFTLFLKSKKKIVSIRGSDWFLLKKSPYLKEIFRSFVAQKLTKFSLRFFDEIIVMSNQMRNQLAHEFPHLTNKIHVIPDGIDLDKFYPKDKLKAKEKLNFPKDKFIIGIGSIDENNSIKRVYLAKKAIHELINRGFPIQLHVLTNIEHDLMNEHINACDMLLHTSLHEGWPNILKEGLACNVPFVSTDVSDLKKITLDKKSGCYITQPLVDNIVESIILVYNNSAKNVQLIPYVEDMEIKHTVELIKQLYIK